MSKVSRSTNKLVKNGFRNIPVTSSHVFQTSIKTEQSKKLELNYFEAEIYAKIENGNLPIDKMDTE